MDLRGLLAPQEYFHFTNTEYREVKLVAAPWAREEHATSTSRCVPSQIHVRAKHYFNCESIAAVNADRGCAPLIDLVPTTNAGVPEMPNFCASCVDFWIAASYASLF